jgi:DNA primase
MFLDILIENLHQAIFRYPEVLRYLQSRNVSEDDVRQYKIGYSKLIGVPEDNSPDRERFMDECYRGRKIEKKIIFPFRDEMGRTVGLIGRAVDTKEFKIFATEKAKHDGFFFGLYEALPHIYEENRAFVVEGPFDYFAFSKVFPNTVGTMTAGISEAQYDYLNLFCDYIITVFDSDAAGQRGTDRIAEEHKKIYSMDLGNYKDPAKCLEVLKLSAFKQFIIKRIPFF